MSSSITDAAEALARTLHADPEVSLAEHRSSAACQALLREWSFDVQAPVAGLETAFVATKRLGDGKGPHIGLLVEFDALPDVGHGCGHNLIAGATLEAAGRLAEDSGLNGTLSAFGTPAEEIFAGKGPMLTQGCFDGVDVVLTYHPFDFDGVWVHSNGVAIVDVVFAGRPAHAASTPWDGRSAQDGVVLTSAALALERQYIGDGHRIHAIMTDSSGSHNVFPDSAGMRVNLRAATAESLARLRRRLEDIVTGVAAATDTQVTTTDFQTAAPFKVDESLATMALDVMGLPADARIAVAGSTDLGDVSQALRTVCIATNDWEPVGWHSRELHVHAGSDPGYASMHRAADHLVAIGGKLITEGIPEQ